MSRCNSATEIARVRTHRAARAAVGGMLLLAFLSACASTAVSPPLYERLGGGPGIEAIVEGMLVRSADDPRIASTFAESDIVNLHAKLSEHLCAMAEGPCTYRGRDMRAAHLGMGLTEAHFNALVENLVDAMVERRVPIEAQNALLAKLAPLRSQVIHQ